ncbi:phospholipase A2 inhibitor and Ly6/PLAUR domain-containing protein-like [Eublepharis macularius]|uniref:Phospholipase A2 inhibitor and Ly6/PLAUR domain-containing protein-like n=1 Tax=Eublepharis macularius TaxID=481883 RepID=A0AA97KDG8_EUBMA|nr:phospholipase A2 inhibitor and Ly6/PLAUR domain-containing protein-like [Eublepharis macularius]
MQTLPRLFLFSVLLATGGFLKCEICSSPSSSCVGERKLCDAAKDVCAIISIENTIGGSEGPRTSLGGGCVLPTENYTNGVQCPACYSTSNSCVSEIINCTGFEDHCFELVSSTRVGEKVIEATMKGCTTKSICLALEEGRSFPIKRSGLAVKEGKCLPRFSRASQPTGLLFPAFSGLLLMKIFS